MPGMSGIFPGPKNPAVWSQVLWHLYWRMVESKGVLSAVQGSTRRDLWFVIFFYFEDLLENVPVMSVDIVILVFLKL